MASRQAQDYLSKGYRPGSIIRVKMVIDHPIDEHEI